VGDQAGRFTRVEPSEMNAEADMLFKGWEGSTASIQVPSLRQRSEQRLTMAKDRRFSVMTSIPAL
jgi:hypothetical protein